MLGSAVDEVGRRERVGIVEDVDGRDGNVGKDGTEVASLSDGARAAGGAAARCDCDRDDDGRCRYVSYVATPPN